MNEKQRHTPPVTQHQSRGDSLSLGPYKIARPPFTTRFTLHLANTEVSQIPPSHRTPCDIVVVGVTLHEVADVLSNGVRTTIEVSAAEAISTALAFFGEQSDGAALCVALMARSEAPGAAPGPLAVSYLRVVCSQNGWSATLLDTRDGTCFCVFPDRATRDSVPTWVWHRLVGEALIPATDLRGRVHGDS